MVQLSDAPLIILEGDEHFASPIDKRPKFIHYRPNIVLLTAVEFDHADIYPDMTAYRAAFQQLLALLPADGTVIACADDPEVNALTRSAPCRVVRYGLGAAPRGQRPTLTSAKRQLAFA